METERERSDGRIDEAFLALSLMGLFAACDWYEARDEKRAPSEPRKARPDNA